MWCCMVIGDLWVWVMTTASAWFSFAVGSGVVGCECEHGGGTLIEESVGDAM